MEPAGAAPVVTVVLIAAVAVLSGPLGPVDLTTAPTCAEAVAVAGLLAPWSLAAAFGQRATRVGAVLFGIAGAVTTNVLCLFAYYYYFGRAFLFPIVPV